MEIVTPATLQAVQRALATKADVTLQKYGRFLEAITRHRREIAVAKP